MQRTPRKKIQRALKTKPYDVAEFLTDPETIAAYLTQALESDDPRYIAKALGAIARARGGMAQLARETGLTREALYRALSETGNPELGTALKVMRALGIRLKVSLAA
jgi:probable addiction module antidote protein